MTVVPRITIYLALHASAQVLLHYHQAHYSHHISGRARSLAWAVFCFYLGLLTHISKSQDSDIYETLQSLHPAPCRLGVTILRLCHPGYFYLIAS